ncbi:MAG: outer membrane lipoprotein-sorting protein [Spirochaetia bacterium]|jgi:outer membrane lipoprotein-sorting protein|nr:outer membrane lipoprotein-sorting protein [Spirochaetia bacterium]
MKKAITIFLVLLIVSLSTVSAISLDDANTILDTVDTSRNFTGTDFSAVMTMISEDPDTGIEKKKVQQFRRDDSDMFLMLFIEPAAEKGQGYLMIDENLWFYDPQSRKFNHTSMKESFGGTDAKNSDFGASSLGDDYKVLTVEEGKLGRFDVYIMDLEGTNSEVTYPTVKIWITKDTNLMLKSEDYSATGRLMRTSLFPSYAKVGDKFLATKMIFNDELIDGKKTQITITDISSKDLPDSIFTKSYVERVNR